MMLADGASLISARVAATPSITGMRRSMRSTSGRCWWYSSMASCPFAASATTWRSGSVEMIAASPARKTGWSSAIRIRIGGVFCMLTWAGVHARTVRGESLPSIIHRARPSRIPRKE
jgi:hypothetical protein